MSEGAPGDRTADEIDVVNSYRLVLGRPPESPQVIASKTGQLRSTLLGDLLGSEEYRVQVLLPLLTEQPMDPDRFLGRPTEAFRSWLIGFAPWSEATTTVLGAAKAWSGMAAAAFEDPAFQALAGEDRREFREPVVSEALRAWAERSAERLIVSTVEFAEPHVIRGWALNAYDPDERLALEIIADGVSVGLCGNDKFRRDLQDRYGGRGLVGFQAKLQLPASAAGRGVITLEVVDTATRAVIATASIETDRQRHVDALGGIRQELARVSEALARVEASLPEARRIASFSTDSYDAYRRAYAGDTPAARERGQVMAEALARRPVFTIAVVAHAPDIPMLADMLRSVVDQDYPDWRLYFYDDASPNGVEIAALVQAFAAEAGDRLQLVRREDQQGEAASVADARGRGAEWLLSFGPHDKLAPDALLTAARALQGEAPPRLLYADDDTVTRDATRRDVYSEPRFKPDFDLPLLLQQEYLDGCAIMDAALWDEAGAGIDPHDPAARRVRAAVIARDQVAHLPRVLLHRRSPVQPSVVIAGVIDEQLERLGWPARAEAHADGHARALPYAYRVRWSEALRPTATVIVPTRDRLELLKPCVESLLATRETNRCRFQLIVVDNDSVDPECLEYLNHLPERGGVRVRRDPSPFNWAALNNAAAAEAEGDILIFLNNDVVAVTPDWCDELAGWATRREIGAVGCRLLYEDGTLQHAGVVIGGEGLPIHEGVGARPSELGHMGRHVLAHRTVAVTGACLATRRDVFDSVGGFDAARYAVIYNDIDYCLKLGERGLWVVYTPHSTFYHYESKSRGIAVEGHEFDRAVGERETFRARWSEQLKSDPFYNPHFEPHAAPFSRLRAPPPLDFDRG